MIVMFHLPYPLFSLKKRSFRKQIVTIDSTIRHLQLQRTFRNKIRNREVACSCTLETKSMVNGEKKNEKRTNEGRYRNVETKNIRSGQAFHYRYIIDLYSIYYKKIYVYIYIYINMRKWSR